MKCRRLCMLGNLTPPDNYRDFICRGGKDICIIDCVKADS